MTLPKEDRYLMTRKELLARIDVLYGGRVAEEVIFGEISTGAQDDIQKATDLAKRMVMEYGMSEVCGQRSFSPERSTFIQSPSGALSAAREYSESVAEKIDSEIQAILGASYKRVTKLLQSKKGLLDQVAKVLTDKEVIDGKELETLIAGFSSRGDDSRSGEINPVAMHNWDGLGKPPELQPT
jgi:cell division protease FtsH